MAEFNRDGLGNVVTVAFGICLLCSIVVSSASVLLKPRQEANKELDRKQNILRAAGLLPEGEQRSVDGVGIDELFNKFDVRLVDLDSGKYAEQGDVNAWASARAAKDPAMSRPLGEAQDRAQIGRRENVSLVYVREGADGLDKLVLPVRGYGLWGTLFGYLALDGNLERVAGISFHSHKETPGLGGEVDSPAWQEQWPGVALFDAAGAPAVRLVKIRSPVGSIFAKHEVDALSGATLTSRGVENLINFWVGDLGFGPYLKRLRESSSRQGATL